MKTYPRSILFVPGYDQHKITKAFASDAHAVCLDLEDSVSFFNYEDAVACTQHYINTYKGNQTILVRPRQASHAHRVSGMHGLVVPKVYYPNDLTAYRGFPLYVTIETMSAVLHVRELASALDVVGLIFGPADLMADYRRRYLPYRMEESVIVTARANGIPVYGTFSSPYTYALEPVSFGVAVVTAQLLYRLGFDGAACLNLVQVSAANAGFHPSPDDQEWARKIMKTTDVCVLDGSIVGPPQRRLAQSILEDA